MESIYDVAIIGAGVSGAAIARKLSQYDLKVAVLEKEKDVSFGVSKANSGIIHGGFHHNLNTLKSKLEIQGNIMFDQLQKDLDFPFERCGIIVAAFNVEEMKTVERLYQQGIENKAIGIELCSKQRIHKLEPNLNKDVIGGLFAPSGGIIEPYRYVFSLMECAKQNGVDIFTDFEVKESSFDNNIYSIKSDSYTVKSKYVINAAGLYADKISEIFGGEKFKIIARKGEYSLLDRNASGKTSKVVFPVPAKDSKGMLIVPTVEGTMMVGPTADKIDDKEDLSTTSKNFSHIFQSARRLVPEISEHDIITGFAGIRPALKNGDFFIKISEKAKNFIQVSGIQSPGLTASPAIGEYVKDLLKKAGLNLVEKKDWNPKVLRSQRIREMNPYEIDKLVNEDEKYGNIICRCESVTEKDIVEAIKKGHTTLDGIKFYTRASMGRCQGGFCTFQILKIIERETGIPIKEITKKGKGSTIVNHKIGDLKINSIKEN